MKWPWDIGVAYGQCLAHELMLDDIRFRFEYPQPGNYSGVNFDGSYQVDQVVVAELIIELYSDIRWLISEPFLPFVCFVVKE